MAYSPSLWLDAGYGITITGSGVSQWADRSGNGNDATQSTDASRPTVASGVVNGRDALLFDGVDDYLMSTCTGKAAGQTVIAVAKNSDTTKATRRVWGFNSFYSVFANLNRWAFYANESSGVVNYAIADTTSWSIVETIRTSNSAASGRINGGTLTEFNPFDQSDGTALAVGAARNNVAEVWTGWIAELIVYPTALSADEIANVRKWLAGKYAITVS